MKTNSEFWETLYDYFSKERLNGDLHHDAEIVTKVKALWNLASYDYLKETDPQTLTNMYRNSLTQQKNNNYTESFQGLLNRFNFLWIIIMDICVLQYGRNCK